MTLSESPVACEEAAELEPKPRKSPFILPGIILIVTLVITGVFAFSLSESSPEFNLDRASRSSHSKTSSAGVYGVRNIAKVFSGWSLVRKSIAFGVGLIFLASIFVGVLFVIMRMNSPMEITPTAVRVEDEKGGDSFAIVGAIVGIFLLVTGLVVAGGLWRAGMIKRQKNDYSVSVIENTPLPATITLSSLPLDPPEQVLNHISANIESLICCKHFRNWLAEHPDLYEPVAKRLWDDHKEKGRPKVSLGATFATSIFHSVLTMEQRNRVFNHLWTFAPSDREIGAFLQFSQVELEEADKYFESNELDVKIKHFIIWQLMEWKRAFEDTTPLVMRYLKKFAERVPDQSRAREMVKSTFGDLVSDEMINDALL